MERYNRITRHNEYKNALLRISKAEQERIYCLHGFEHALDVARIAYITALENNSVLTKDIIYAAAFLHDCGRFAQYEDGTPHDVKSAELAARILPDCGYSAEETSAIISAIRYHRRGRAADSELGILLYNADKLSRDCRRCAAQDTCYWSDDEKNSDIAY